MYHPWLKIPLSLPFHQPFCFEFVSACGVNQKQKLFFSRQYKKLYVILLSEVEYMLRLKDFITCSIFEDI